MMVLGRLTYGPMHGYMIAKVLGRIMGPFRQLQWGALYPVLSKLEREGLIRAEESVEDGEGRPRKVYAITQAGRERLHEHLMDTTRHRGEYDSVFSHKVGLFVLLTPAERLFLCRDYAVYAQQNVDHLQASCRLLQVEKQLPPGRLENVMTVLEHRIDYWQRERAWAESLIAEQNQLIESATEKEAV